MRIYALRKQMLTLFLPKDSKKPAGAGLTVLNIFPFCQYKHEQRSQGKGAAQNEEKRHQLLGKCSINPRKNYKKYANLPKPVSCFIFTRYHTHNQKNHQRRYKRTPTNDNIIPSIFRYVAKARRHRLAQQIVILKNQSVSSQRIQ